MFSHPQLQQLLEQYGRKMHVSQGTVLLEPGQFITVIPIVTKGCLRVLRQNEQGDETFLYHIMPGESCAMSLTCCAMHKASEIKAIAEEDTELWAVPIEQITQWESFKEWKDFIANTYQSRFNKMLQVIDDIAFKKMDERLWHYLLARSTAKQTNILHISHEEIAQELNIQREAATRLMKKLKETGCIETGRNEIKIIKKSLEA